MRHRDTRKCEALFTVRLHAKGTCWGLAMTLSTIGAVPSLAQISTPIIPPIGAPWNAQQVFETPEFPQASDFRDPDETAPEDMPVKTRQHPGYEPVGIRSGSWMFNPSVTFGTIYDSNVFASNTNPRGDTFAQARASLAGRSLWERHALSFQADVRTDQYLNYPGLNQTDASIKARGRYDIRHDIAVLTNFQAAYLHEGVGSLSSPTGAVQPTPYNYLTGDITYRQEFNRWIVSLGGRIDSYDFGTTRAQNGTIIRQDSRDGQVYTAHGRVDYLLSPKLAIFSATEVNTRDIRGVPGQTLDSHGYRALAGVHLEVSRLVNAEIAAGYGQQTFDDPLISTIAGPTYRATIVWRPTRRIDVTFKAEQIVTQATDTDSSGVKADAAQLGIDYELLRNTFVSVAGVYEHDTFVGQNRRDNVYGSLAELKYLLNRFSSISLQHRYIRRGSSVPTSNYDKHEVGIRVTAQF